MHREVWEGACMDIKEDRGYTFIIRFEHDRALDQEEWSHNFIRKGLGDGTGELRETGLGGRLWVVLVGS